MHRHHRADSARTPGLSICVALIAPLLTLVTATSTVVRADVPYAYDDGSAERGIGIDPGEDSLWFNRFTVAPGGERITSISAAFSRPGVSQTLNGLPIKVLLYEDLDGGSPFNAVLKTSVDAVVSNAATNILTTYNIPATEVHGTFLAAILLRNRYGENKFIAALDQTAPTFADSSFYAYTEGDMSESNLASVPDGQFGTIESIGFPGNWLIRANGTPVPEPATISVLTLALCSLLRRRRV